MLGLGAVEMRAFDCMRRVRAREVVARAYGDAGVRCADRTARRYTRSCAGSGSARGRRLLKKEDGAVEACTYKRPALVVS